ncbi:hypothetical protein CN373_02355 [Bacillus cereus]|uniref:Uncharacterized protein n=1 Tax=Bacillus cereus TaxID=1396 RepID=A0AA44TGN7_BACCE|nr:hypothetical protein CN373_02355 [Bacillus cereus]PFN09183.1 hypothetical protein COJ55_04165 [Bacillus cereus]PFR24962.1 hypothetical protein COK19_16575 [Bacillus cereus]PFS07757.1 hypothetical protein COK38_01145 [Bacillus cereus]PGZ18710.1 hypothetical protein COE46_05775 [Bacillus cereus]
MITLAFYQRFFKYIGDSTKDINHSTKIDITKSYQHLFSNKQKKDGISHPFLITNYKIIV